MLLIILIALTAWLLGLILPWWSVAIPGLILGAWLGEKGTTSFLYGFLGAAILWLIQTLSIHLLNDGILTARIANVFSVPHPSLVLLLTALIGGLASGLSTLTGYLFRRAIRTSWTA